MNELFLHFAQIRFVMILKPVLMLYFRIEFNSSCIEAFLNAMVKLASPCSALINNKKSPKLNTFEISTQVMRHYIE